MNIRPSCRDHRPVLRDDLLCFIRWSLKRGSSLSRPAVQMRSILAMLEDYWTNVMTTVVRHTRHYLFTRNKCLWDAANLYIIYDPLLTLPTIQRQEQAAMLTILALPSTDVLASFKVTCQHKLIGVAFCNCWRWGVQVMLKQMQGLEYLMFIQWANWLGRVYRPITGVSAIRITDARVMDMG